MQAFCTEEYVTTHPDDVIHTTRLKELFAEQVCYKLHLVSFNQIEINLLKSGRVFQVWC